METILLSITVVSLLVALVMGIAAWRIQRDERARQGARVAALAAAAARESTTLFAVDAAPPAGAAPEFTGFDRDPAATAVTAPGAWPQARVSPLSASRPAVAASRAPEIAPDFTPQELPSPPEVPPTSSPSSTAHSFLEVDAPRPSEGRQRGLAVAAAVLFVVLGSGAYWLISGNQAAVPGTAVAAEHAPLELMSLRHERVGGRLTLSGLVRNPAAGAPVDGLTAVVFLFDAKGTFITSARAGVDFTHLAAGDESPFVIHVDAPSNVARYRVSFRTDAGTLAHVDRRSEQPATAAIAGSQS